MVRIYSAPVAAEAGRKIERKRPSAARMSSGSATSFKKTGNAQRTTRITLAARLRQESGGSHREMNIAQSHPKIASAIGPRSDLPR
jgi:hypothetical protein